MNRGDFENLNPFEIKQVLIQHARAASEASAASFVNAGRGSPNWVATSAREAFFLLGQFAMSECRREEDLPPGMGGMPKAPSIGDRLQDWLASNIAAPGAAFLIERIPWAIEKFGFVEDSFVHELVDATVGDNYSVPGRMLAHSEVVVREYLQWAMCGEPRPEGTFKLYAVEGGTAAMCYIFKSLKANRLLNPGDAIAVSVPVFAPYLEMPVLEDHGLEVVSIHALQENRFHIPDDLDKLLDPKIKAFFVVNPGNPSAMALSEEAIARIGQVLEKRPDLILLTDDVYGTFVPGFRSLLGAYPRNTIGVYSFSKYFGCTGWRLGVVAIHKDNVFDELIAKHPAEVLARLDRRYASIALDPRKLPLIDRIVADSRDVALNHTAGLSPPQQAMMCLFSLCELMDEKKDYQRGCLGIVKKRVAAMIDGLGIELPTTPLFDNYYGLIDLDLWMRKNLGAEAAAWVKTNVHPLDPVFRLAAEQGIVVLNGGGFAAPDWSVRVSFANLPDYAYDDIGRAVRSISHGYREAYEASLQPPG